VTEDGLSLGYLRRPDEATQPHDESASTIDGLEELVCSLRFGPFRRGVRHSARHASRAAVLARLLAYRQPCPGPEIRCTTACA
jgi:hypothetical protein